MYLVVVFPNLGEVACCRRRSVPQQLITLLLPKQYALGVPSMRAAWVHLLSGADYVGCLVGLIGSQFDWLPGSALYEGCKPLVGRGQVMG